MCPTFLQDLANRSDPCAELCSLNAQLEHLRAECGMTIARHRWRGPLALLTALTAAAVTLAGCGTDSGGGSGTATSGAIQVWEGYTGADAKAFAHLVAG